MRFGAGLPTDKGIDIDWPISILFVPEVADEEVGLILWNSSDSLLVIRQRTNDTKL